MFLATTALKDFWDVKDRVVFLGPWCTRHDRQDTWAHLDYRFLPNPWDDRERFHQAWLYCRRVGDHLLGELGAFLNQAHGVTMGRRYWQILLGPWLSCFIDIFYDRYVHIKEAFTLYPEIDTLLLDEIDYLIPWDYLQFSTLQAGDLYNLQLYSQIIRYEGHAFPSRRATSRLSSAPLPLGRRGNMALLKEVLRKLEAFVLKAGFAHQDVAFLPGNLTKWMKYRLVFTPGFSAGFIPNGLSTEDSQRVTSPHSARRDLSGITTSGDAFVRLLLEALPGNFPGIYLEGFQRVRNLVKESYGYRNFPKILLSLGGFWGNEYGQFLGGEIAARGGRIISFQHGAGYGFSRLLENERYERQISDKFFSWGWSGQEPDPKLVDLPGAKLFRNPHRAGKSSQYRMILVVGTVYPRYLYRFQSYPVGTQWLRYIQATMDFLAAVEPQRQGDLVYRKNVIDYGWGIPEQIKERLPQVAIDHHRHSFHRQMKQARLVVFDHLGTTFLEAMAANVPSIMFFDLKYWEVRAEVQPYLELLRQAGIFYDTPQDVAQQVNRIYDCIDDWWFDPHRQEVRKRFADHFALSSPCWNRQWVEAIRREVREVQDGSISPGM